MQVIRQVIEERPNIDLPRLITESVSGNTLKDNLTSYFKEGDIPIFLNIMKENNIYIAGGFVLKNFLQNQPGYDYENWSNTDIDFWAVSSSDTHQDPYCPLRKFLRSQGYESRILCSKGRINQLPADYKRLKNFIEQIEEWYQIDYSSNNEKKNLLQLMLLKDYNSHKNNIKKELFFDCKQPFNDELFEQTLTRKGIHRYELREATDFIIDAILTFDLTCCQCSFSVDENNPEGIITFYGTILDYPGQTPIIKNVLRYLTKISANIFRTQGLLEWSRTLKRSAKYAFRGFTVVNWTDIVDTIIQRYEFTTIEWNEKTQYFLGLWNRFVYDNRFYLFSLNIPIFYVTYNDEGGDLFKLNTFTLRNRRLRFYGLTQLNPSPFYKLDPFANFRVTKKITYNMVVALTGDVGYMNPKDFKYYETVIPYKYMQLPYIPYRYNGIGERIDIDEKTIIETENPECYDPITLIDENNVDYLKENTKNILLVFRKDSQTLSIECWNKNSIAQIAENPTNVLYKCRDVNEYSGRRLLDMENILSVYGFVDTSMEYIRISSKGIYISGDDYKKLLYSNNKIFYLVEPFEKIQRVVSKNVYKNELLYRRGMQVQSDYLLGASHCQDGSQMLLYQIKVCGGPECLPFIFGDGYPKKWLSDDDTEYDEYHEEINEDDEEPYAEHKEEEEKEQEEKSQDSDDEDDENGGPPGGFPLQRSGPIRPPPIMIPPRSSAQSSGDSVPSTPRIDDVSRRLDFDELDSEQEASDDEEEHIGTIGDHLTDSLIRNEIDMITPIMYDFEEALHENRNIDVDINGFELDGVRWASLALNNNNLSEDDILGIFDWLKSHGFIFSYENRVNSPLKKAIDRIFLNVIDFLFEDARISRSRRVIDEAINYTRGVHRSNPELMNQIIDKLNGYLEEEGSDQENDNQDEDSDQENDNQENEDQENEDQEEDVTQILFNKLQTETSKNEIKTLIDNLTEDEIERIQVEYPAKSILYYLLQNPVIKGDINLFRNILNKLSRKGYFYYIKEVIEAKPTLEFLRLIGQQNTSTLFYDSDDLESILEEVRERNEDSSYDNIINYFENINR